MMPIYKRCSKCNTRIPSGSKCICTDKRYKEEDKHLKGDIYKAFYKTGRWQQTRQKAIDTFDGLDVYEYYIEERIRHGQTMHHIVPLKDDYSKGLDLLNLIYLTESNHKKLHLEMDKSPQNKARVQGLLFELAMRYRRELGKDA